MRGARWSWRVRKSSIWSSRPKKAARRLRRARLAGQGRIGAQPGVAPAEGDGVARERGVGTDGARLVRQLPGAAAERLDGHVGQLGPVAHRQLGDRDHQSFGRGPGRRHQPVPHADEQAAVGVDDDLHDRGGGPGAGPHHGAREHRAAGGTGDDVDDHDGTGGPGRGLDVDQHRVDGERVVEEREVVRVGQHRAEQGVAVGVVGRTPQRHHVVVDGGGEGGQHAVDGDDESAPGPEPVHQCVDALGGRRTGVVPGADVTRRLEPVEVELVDPAVAPDLVLLGRER